MGEMTDTEKTTTKQQRRGAIVLRDDVTTPTVVPGVLRGEFVPGVAVALSALGLTEREARLLIEEGAPFRLTTVQEG